MQSMQQREDDNRLLISVEEAAQILGIGRTHAYALVKWKMIKSVKIGRTRRVVLSSLNEYVKQLLGEE